MRLPIGGAVALAIASAVRRASNAQALLAFSRPVQPPAPPGAAAQPPCELAFVKIEINVNR